MTFNYLLLYITFLLLSFKPIALTQELFPHYYLYLSSDKPDTSKIEYGSFFISKTKLKKQKYSGSTESWKKELITKIDCLPLEKTGVLIYLHGFMGDNTYFVEESGYVLQNELFDRTEHRYGLAISLQWAASVDYKKSKENALYKGAYFVNIINEIYEHQMKSYGKSDISIICHSMGNRVFEGLYNKLRQEENGIKINKLFLMAADLENDIFTDTFIDLPKMCDTIFIYHNLNDRTLAMANAVMPYKRLGIYGPVESDSLADNVLVANVSDMNDDETFAGKWSLHRYYYGSPSVRKQLLQYLSETSPKKHELNLKN